MSEISQMKVLEGKSGFYLGRTLKEREKEIPYSRDSIYFDDKKEANKALNMHHRAQEKRLNNLERKLSIEIGVNLQSSEKSQYLVALDPQKKSTPVVIKIPPFEKGEHPKAFIDGNEKGKLLEALDYGKYKVMRATPEIDRINKTIERESHRNSEIHIGTLDTENKIIASMKIDPIRVNSIGRDKFIENAVAYFQKCVILTKDEFDRSRIVGEEVTIGKERLDLGKELELSRGLER